MMEIEITPASGVGGRTAAAPNNYQGIIQPPGFPGLPEGFTSETETFKSAEPTVTLFGVYHQAARAASKRPKRILFIAHGYGEHGGRYLHVPHYLKSVYDGFYCLDQRGHGRAEGLRGHVDRFEYYPNDLATAIRHVHAKLGGQGAVELDLLAHSMGGLIALMTAFRSPELPIRNLIVTSPLLGIAVQVPAVKVAAGKLLSNIWPTLHMSNEVHPEHLSRDRGVGETYMKDRLVSSKTTPRWYTELLLAMEDTRKRDSGIQWPFLLLVPGDDKIVDEKEALAFFRALKHPDKELHTYDGYYHEILNENGKEKVFEDIARWVQGRSSKN